MLTASCAGTSFTAVPVGAPDDASRFAGTWEASGSTIIVDDVQGDRAHVTLTDKGQTIGDEPVQLLNVRGTQIVIVASPAGTYDILRVGLTGDALEIWPLDEEQLRSDVEQGVIAGSIVSHIEDVELVRVEASSLDLASYIQSHPDLFGSAPEAVYTRVGGRASTAAPSTPALLIAAGLLLAATALAFVLWWRRT
jgi:hypothetical protein